jgi:hypothetical protein
MRGRPRRSTLASRSLDAGSAPLFDRVGSDSTDHKGGPNHEPGSRVERFARSVNPGDVQRKEPCTRDESERGLAYPLPSSHQQSNKSDRKYGERADE